FTFIYKASHDLKGPLSSVIGLTNLALEDKQNEKNQKYFDLINQCTFRLNLILDDLTEIAKVTQGSMNIQKLDLNKMVKDIVASLQHNDNCKNIDFRVNIETLPDFYSSSYIVYSILQNLIDNGIKYKKLDGTGSFVSININGDTSGGIVIKIADNGQGIDPVIKSQIFDMFFRGNEDSKGSGLGLYITKKAIERLEGSISVDSTLDVGTNIVIELKDLRYLSEKESGEDDAASQVA
ncbi:MAG: HAMP domain-containing histidine kinase, partial [Bacteroidetes bacterium]|nr:HAMP domain-containing histidine kinase [Bacteroidota bacterium]